MDLVSPCIDSLEKAMAPHSSTLAWKIPWMEEPGGLQSMGWQRVRHDWTTSLSLFAFMHWRRKWQPTPVFLPGESQGRGAWWAAVYGVAQSRTRLKWLSSSSSRFTVISFTKLRFGCSPLKGQYLGDKYWLERKGHVVQEASNLGRRWTLVQKPTSNCQSSSKNF